MELPEELAGQGFSLQDAEKSDLKDYIGVKRICYTRYVDEYYGGWIENIQIKMNTDSFEEMLGRTCVKKVLFGKKPVGFFSYHEGEDKIDGISIQLIDEARNKGVGSFYLRFVTGLSDKTGKPVYLKVFQSNPAKDLYRRFGFRIYSKTAAHYLMRYDPAKPEQEKGDGAL